jgi:large subunit ribosomal protein L13
MEFFQRKRLVLYEVPEAKLRLRPLLRYVTLEEVWRNVDPAAWEQWKKARDMWEKKIKQQASG